MRLARRPGAANKLYVLGLCSLAAVLLLCGLLLSGDGWLRLAGRDTGSSAAEPAGSGGSPSGSGNRGDLLVYCAAGMRYAMDDIARAYRDETGRGVQLTYGGSNTLLNQLEVSRTGDLYLAADDSYLRLAREKGLAVESVPLARLRPVIIVRKQNPRRIETLADLWRDDVKVALASPDAAAVGQLVKQLLEPAGLWEKLERQVTRQGVFQATVNEVANDVQLGSVDAGVVWDSTVAQYPELEAVRVPELDAGQSLIQIMVLDSARDPTAALHFARFAGARDKGLTIFRKVGFDVVEGDVWAERPELNFYVGSVNRRALEPIIQQFERREGVQVNTVYNGCGILTAQMRTLRDAQSGAFPDSYMACDVYYLQTVQDLFEQGTDISDTDIVIVVPRGNPQQIRTLADLARPGLRVALGQPDQCTIGVLSKRLLEDEGLYDAVRENLVQETPTSAMLVPNITTGSADAVLAYRTDTLAESERLEVLPINSPLSKAIQPFSTARSSDHKQLSRRLFDAIARSREKFESAGFNWRLD
ncbi:MAG: molybdate ABC transporter substrate-binding protein [Pirellulaceae bacterium]|nr:molybdate ABC transporter substrate-binding protein [Pirellulaceae bacterium]